MRYVGEANDEKGDYERSYQFVLNLVFISESIENIPTGWRAKETYQIINDNEFVEIFELAELNKDFELYSRVLLKKLK